jgi:hypothetical protein
MSDKVGGYAEPKPGGFSLDDLGTGGLRFAEPKPGVDKAVIKGTKPGG